ncbi:LacI family DNA-binding transcriptional regulator [Jutongia sp.]
MKKTGLIGVLFADKAESGLTHDFFAAILDSFMKTIQTRGYQMCFLNTNKDCPNRKTYMEQVRERQFDGVAVICIDFDDPEVVELFQSGIPVVTIDERIDGVISVESDNTGGMVELMHYLIEMKHKRIAYITGEDCHVTRTRLKAYSQCCREAGIELQADYVLSGRFRDINQASYLTETLMRLPDPPTCIIYPDDYAAIGGLNVLRARGLEIPGDISIAGYDGIDITSRYEPRIATVIQNKQALGHVSADRLLEWIENPDYVLENTISIATKLQKGRSVSRAFY